MGRSGYGECDGDENIGSLNCYRANVYRALSGKRGQAFLREMAGSLDAMPVKELVADELVSSDGHVCAMGAVALARQIDVSDLDVSDAYSVGDVFGIAECMAREIAHVNDDDVPWSIKNESPAERWKRVREWVSLQIKGNAVKESYDDENPGEPLTPLQLRARVADLIEQHPELHDQGVWGDHCETACCVAGWAVRIGGRRDGESTIDAAASTASRRWPAHAAPRPSSDARTGPRRPARYASGVRKSSTSRSRLASSAASTTSTPFFVSLSQSSKARFSSSMLPALRSRRTVLLRKPAMPILNASDTIASN